LPQEIGNDKSEAFEAIHSSASTMFKVGAHDKATMRHFDASCLAVPESFAPEQIKRIRVSQPIFARFLNTSESTVEKWESGAKSPAAWPSSSSPSSRSTA
jgi:putative transcriptional regulator